MVDDNNENDASGSGELINLVLSCGPINMTGLTSLLQQSY